MEAGFDPAELEDDEEMELEDDEDDDDDELPVKAVSAKPSNGLANKEGSKEKSKDDDNKLE